MAAIAGRNGSVSFTSGFDTNVFNWSIEKVQEVADVTIYDSAGISAFIPTRTMWTGQYEAYADTTDLMTLPSNATILGVATLVDGTGGEEWSGSIIITSVNKTVAFDGAAAAVFSFQGTGALATAATA